MATLSNVELDALAHSLACENAIDIERHVLYLETRGLIQRDETHPNWIALRNEEEATR